MAVSSPYAVFKAADVCWPLVLPPAWAANTPGVAAAADAGGGRQDQRTQQAASTWCTMVQGELFHAN